MGYSLGDLVSDTTGVLTGGLYGSEDMGFIDDITGAGMDYLRSPGKAADAQQEAAKSAQGYVQQYGDMALGTQGGLADRGMQDYDLYRTLAKNEAYRVDPSQYQTGQYSPQSQFNAPGFNQFQRGADPQFQRFQRGADPQFQRADAGDFQFDYQQSPGYQHALQQGLGAIEGRHSAQGSRFTGGADKDLIDYAGGMAAQDYGNQYNRARGQFESDRGFGERQAQAQNIFEQGNYQFGMGMDAGQQNLMNQQNLANYQFGTGADIGQSNLANQANMQNYWQGQQMGMGDRQFGAGFNQGANLQNYNMMNQQNQQTMNQLGQLAGYGPASQTNLADLQFNQGTALGNAALGVGNANANRAMAGYNTANDLINTTMQGVSAGTSLMQGLS